MTFCKGGKPKCADYDKCNRALTQAVSDQAYKWWNGPGAPIALFTNPNERDCYKSPAKTKKP